MLAEQKYKDFNLEIKKEIIKDIDELIDQCDGIQEHMMLNMMLNALLLTLQDEGDRFKKVEYDGGSNGYQ